MNVWIADDEPLALQKLKLFLSQSDDVRVDREFTDGASLLAALLKERDLPDGLITDIQMPGMTGMDVLERLPCKLPVIVTTAWEQYALPSWNLDVTDYLLKPFSRNRLEQALSRVRETLRLKELDKNHPQAVIRVKSEGLTLPVDLSEVACLEARGDYVRFIIPNRKPILVAGTLSSFENLLPAKDFIRVHRSYIVNVRFVVALSPREITIRGDRKVPVGRTYKDKISLISQNLAI